MTCFLFKINNIDFPFLLGMITAIVHVLTGPDHLAAVTPLILETKEKHWQIGLLWGTGHIIGMLLIGILYFFFRDYLPIETISNYSEQLVGVILIGLGLLAFYRIKHEKSNHKHPHYHLDNESSILHIHGHHHPHRHGDEKMSHEHSHYLFGKEIPTLHFHGDHQGHVHQKAVSQTGITAAGIGIIHGFAGIAHFVLMLPVLGYEKMTDSVMYFTGFGIGIITAMVVFAAITGYFSNPSDHHPDKGLLRNLRFWGGLAAILVGIYWLFG